MSLKLQCLIKIMNETPPLPQPGGATCPNCGAAQSADVAYCSNCGAPMTAATPSYLSPSSKLIISLALGFGALLFGALGGCFALMGGLDTSSFNLLGLVFVGVPILLALACIWGIFKVRSR